MRRFYLAKLHRGSLAVRKVKRKCVNLISRPGYQVSAEQVGARDTEGLSQMKSSFWEKTAMCKRISILLSVVCLCAWAAFSSPDMAAQSPELAEIPIVIDGENTDPLRDRVVTVESAVRHRANADPAAQELNRLFRKLNELTPDDRDKHRAALVELKQARHELALQIAKTRQDLRDAEAVISAAEADRASALRTEEVAKRNLDEATLQAAAATFAKKLADEMIKAAQSAQETAKQTQSEAEDEQKAAEKNAAAAEGLKDEATSEEEAARKLKEGWLRKEEAARQAKEAAAAVEADAMAARENAAQIEASARSAHATAVAKQAVAERAEEDAEKAETAAEEARDAATKREEIVTGLKQEAAAREQAASDQVSAAAKRVESARKTKQKLDNVAENLEQQQEELIAKVHDLLVEAGLEQPLEILEYEEPLGDPPVEVDLFSDESEDSESDSSNSYHRGRRKFFFRGR